MSSAIPGTSFLPAVSPDESDVEAELEVDQLDSDSEADELADPAKPSTSKNGNARPGERVPGHTLLPAMRLENMIQADGVTGNLALSKEGLYVLSIATEEFIKRFVQAGHREASAHRRNQINYIDMAATTQQYQEFLFLGETIPSPVSLIDALMLRQEKERELLEDNPALAPLSPTPQWQPAPLPEPPIQYEYEEVRMPKKSRSNGKEKANGSGSTSRKGGSKKSANGHHSHVHGGSADVEMTDSGANHLPSEPAQSHSRRSGRNGTSSLSASVPTPAVNGHPPSTVPSRSETPSYSREDSMDSTSHQAAPAQYPTSHSPPYVGQEESAWPAQFTGPASGFLQPPSDPFGSHAAQNPGRTIYSQSSRPD